MFGSRYFNQKAGDIYVSFINMCIFFYKLDIDVYYLLKITNRFSKKKHQSYGIVGITFSFFLFHVK